MSVFLAIVVVLVGWVKCFHLLWADQVACLASKQEILGERELPFLLWLTSDDGAQGYPVLFLEPIVQDELLQQEAKEGDLQTQQPCLNLVMVSGKTEALVPLKEAQR